LSSFWWQTAPADLRPTRALDRANVLKGYAMWAWDQSLCIGDVDIDSQHVILFALMNQLDIDIDGDKSHTSVDYILRAMAYYVDFHFRYEETMLAQQKYPGLEDHKIAHMKFVLDLIKMKKEANQAESKLEVALKLRNWGTTWLVDHILNEDTAYAKYFAERDAELKKMPALDEG
jgi:hemerythrin